MSDGETPEEAMEMGRDAFKCWMAAYIEEGREIPAPGSNGPASGRFNLRAPRSHAPQDHSRGAFLRLYVWGCARMRRIPDLGRRPPAPARRRVSRRFPALGAPVTIS